LVMKRPASTVKPVTKKRKHNTSARQQLADAAALIEKKQEMRKDRAAAARERKANRVFTHQGLLRRAFQKRKRAEVPRRLCKKTTPPISARQQRADAAAAQNWRRRQDRRKARLAAQYSQRNAKRMLTHQGLLRRALQTSAVEVLRRVCKKTTPPAPVPQTLRAILQRSGNLPRPSEGSAGSKRQASSDAHPVGTVRSQSSSPRRNCAQTEGCGKFSFCNTC